MRTIGFFHLLGFSEPLYHSYTVQCLKANNLMAHTELKLSIGLFLVLPKNIGMSSLSSLSTFLLIITMYTAYSIAPTRDQREPVK